MARRQRDELLASAIEEWIAVTKRAGRCWTSVAKAARCRVRWWHSEHGLLPKVCAASCTSCQLRFSAVGLFGFTSTPIDGGLRDSSCSSSSRFGPSSSIKELTPVTLPPGRLRLATRPISTGSPPIEKDDRNRCGRRLGSSAAAVPAPRSRRPARPSRPPAPAADRIDPPPSGIRSPRFGPRRSRFLLSPAGTRQRVSAPPSGDLP